MSSIVTPQDSVPSGTAHFSARSVWFAALLSLFAGTAVAYVLGSREPARFPGRLEAQTAFVHAAHSGILTDLRVKEGDRVSVDDVLASLTDPELESRIAAASAEIAVRTSEQEQAKAAAEIELTWRIKELDDAIVATELKSADYLKERFDWELERSMWADVMAGSQTAMFEDASPAFQSIVLSARMPGERRMHAILKHETADNAVAVSGVQVEICQEALGRLQRTKQRLPEQIRQKSGVAVAGERLAQAQTELSRLEARRADLVVRSNAVGAVGLFRARPGDHLQPGDPIVEILDDARRWVVASIPSSSVPSFAPEQIVRLTFPGGLIRTGRVVSVAPQADRTESSLQRDPAVSVRIEESGAAWPAVPLGSRIEVQLAD